MEAGADSDRQAGGVDQRQGPGGVIVLGASRSGTSAIARAFVAAGFFAGREEELLSAAPSNPVGHFEPLPVLRMNERLLDGALSAAPSREDLLSRRDEVVPQLRLVLDSLHEKGDGAPLAIKEPRINRLLTLWGSVIDGRLHPVLAVRDPLEVARSIARRDETPVDHALAGWEVQTTLALDWLHGRLTTVAPYSWLMTQPGGAAEMVRAAADHLATEHAEKVEPGDADVALQPDLRNQNADGAVHAEYLTQRQAELWRYLAELPAGNATLSVPFHLRQPSAAALAAARAEDERVRQVLDRAALSTARNEAVARVTELERELHEVRTSFSWRATSPLRRLARRGRRGSRSPS